VGKVKAKFSTSSILKKKSTKIILKKKYIRKYCSKTKIMWGNIVTIHSVLKKKLQSKILNQLNMKKNKIDKDHFGKTNS
jgi:hypothetical protein